ncbi:ester cyclase [Aestuariibaculum sp. YM273]|uniref:ester cyclase n=1 Tax=Aestuariibaculum sp. YM273 TaxID=3070659 RepID=UPI0027DC979F|nr:ester cyclase [Aestuariibaculum sp. YM273]WMI64753.1 ester cyclase [Aestuariibaculum sp. YM273]
MKTTLKILLKITTTSFVLVVLLASCSNSQTKELEAKIASLESQLKTFTDAQTLTEQRLMTFDTLDYDFFTNQKWDKFSHSHTNDILVYNADGTVTEGLFPSHIDDLKPMFIFAPDTRIENHPVRFGNGDWTAVIGELEGTFTEPMPIGEGKTIPPTGKKFKLRMATIGHWKEGKMIEEYLFYDNQDFMKQIGLAQ